MPERTQQARPKPDLARRVEETLEAIEVACANLARLDADADEAELEAVAAGVARAAADSAGADMPDPAPRVVGRVEAAPDELLADDDFVAALSEDLDVLLAEAGQAAESIAGEGDSPPPSRVQPQPAADEPAEAALADADDAAGERATGEAEGIAEPAIEEVAIEDLDDELAGLARAMVEGAFEDASGAVDESPQVKRAEPLAAAEPTPAAIAGSGKTAETAARGNREPEAAQAVAGARAARAPQRSHAKRAALVAAARWAGRLAAPLGARGLLIISKPTAGLSASTRDTIGWLGLYTAFLGLCVWGFLLLFRKPIMPEPTVEAVNILGTSGGGEADGG